MDAERQRLLTRLRDRLSYLKRLRSEGEVIRQELLPLDAALRDTEVEMHGLREELVQGVTAARRAEIRARIHELEDVSRHCARAVRSGRYGERIAMHEIETGMASDDVSRIHGEIRDFVDRLHDSAPDEDPGTIH